VEGGLNMQGQLKPEYRYTKDALGGCFFLGMLVGLLLSWFLFL
jgi:hypothetical protein